MMCDPIVISDLFIQLWLNIFLKHDYLLLSSGGEMHFFNKNIVIIIN